LTLRIKLATPNIDDFFFEGAVRKAELPIGCFFFFPNKDLLPRDSPLVSDTAADAATLLAATLVAVTLSSSVLCFRIWEAACAEGIDDTLLNLGISLLEAGDRNAVGEVTLVGVIDEREAVSEREKELDLEIRCMARSFRR
jgi:hypothetical protein